MGKEKDFAPDDLVHAPGGRESDAPTPGKMTRSDGLTGNPDYDNAPYCERGPRDDGCGLDSGPRGAMLADLSENIGAAGENQKLALVTVKQEILSRRDEDLGLMPQLVLAVLGSTVGNVIGPIAALLKGKAAESVSDDTIKTVVKSVVGFYSKKIEGGAKRVSADQAKGAKLDVLDEIMDGVDTSSRSLRLHARSQMTDAQLMVLAKAMEPERHKPSMYVAAVHALLARFAKSGVTQIGRGFTPDSPFKEDRRVVWITVDGSRELFYQHQDASQHSWGEPAQGKFGELARPVSGGGRSPATVGEPVPREFWDAAVAKHQERWGSAPATSIARTDVAAARVGVAARQTADDAREVHP